MIQAMSIHDDLYGFWTLGMLSFAGRNSNFRSTSRLISWTSQTEGKEKMETDDLKDNDREKKIKDLHVRIPWRLAERVKAHAEENDTTITNVVIEALDAFLRGPKE